MAVIPQHRSIEELIAAEAVALRPVLLRVHAAAARREDLEDIYSVAVIELLKRARRDPTLATVAHVRSSLRQKFESRILDHHRAVAGRSSAVAAGASACPLELVADTLPAARDTLGEVLQRHELREVLAASRALSADQREALASHVAGETPAECCARQGWTEAKRRKLTQRGRARLRAEMSAA